jgi:hypothetical protein
MVKQIKHVADDKVMTLAEIEAFCLDARNTGATGTEIPVATASIGGKVKALTVVVVTPRATASDGR